MDIDKYVDMAYNNPKGQRWYEVLYSENIWSLWKNKIYRRINKNTDPKFLESYVKRIVIEAVWHFGYAQDYMSIKEMGRCAHRLRHPPEEGAGVVYSGASRADLDMKVGHTPWELVEFDAFLEYYVRPLL